MRQVREFRRRAPPTARPVSTSTSARQRGSALASASRAMARALGQHGVQHGAAPDSASIGPGTIERRVARRALSDASGRDRHAAQLGLSESTRLTAPPPRLVYS
jgi:hypothetical protein